MNAGGGLLSLTEGLEHMREETDVDPFPAVSHPDLNFIFRPLDGDLDRTTLRRELHCIAEEIPHDLLETRGVDHDHPDRRTDRRAEHDRAGIRARPDRLDGGADDGPGIDFLDVQAHFAGYDPGHIEHVVDE